ncbi:SprT family protein [Leuconostoc citreum]|uniref:SprT family protein n=1 Tax=Leuconostoc citreum TaxID=33964 RepID=UPI000A1F3752|nr:SprT family protein [Leuconostoc citreum]OSP82058.1 SprT family protein [Leuconostoc citreum]
MMTEIELQNLVKQVSISYFNLTFQHKASFNRRLKTTGGRYLLQTHNLEFNPSMSDLPEFIGIIKHELVHYHLHIANKGYQHRDLDFKQLLQRVAGLRYAPKLSDSKKHYRLWLYRCQNQHSVYLQRRFNTANYRCAKCGERFNFIGQVNHE